MLVFEDVLSRSLWIIFTSVLAFFVFKVTVFMLRVRNLYKVFGKCPGLGNEHFSWIYGNMHKIPSDGNGRLLFFKNLMNTKGADKFSILWLGPFIPRLFLHHPETMKEILQTAEPKPRDVAGSYRMVMPWLGDGLLVSGGTKWSRSRRLLTPAFHFNILRSYIDVYNEATNQFLNNVSHVKSGESFELFSRVSLCTLDIMLRCAFSYEANCQSSSETHPYVTAVKELTDLLCQRTRNIWLYPDILFNLSQTGRNFHRYCDYVHKFAEDIIEKRKKYIWTEGLNNRKYLDFLDILLTARDENGNGLTALEIRNEVDTFLFEGHDTTASAISWIIYSLAEHQEYQEKVYKEIEEIIADREHGEIIWVDLGKMDTLTLCIKEGMRLHSPVPIIGRQSTEDRVICGINIPAGISFALNIYALHHNPKIWQNPSEFIPERFTKSNSADRNPFMFTPFSAGPRNCIGQNFAMNEIKVFLAKLLHRFRITLDTSHEVKHVASVVMRATNGIKVFAEPRTQNVF